MNAKWIRVSRKRKCEICEHPDWCTYSPDLGLVLCMRVESARPSTNSMGGWIHRVSDPRPSFIPQTIRPAIQERPPDLETLWRRWSRDTNSYHVDGFAMSLGVSTGSLQAIGCAWNGRAWAFPMKHASGKMIGIRLRSESGDKWAVRGSHQGLFFSDVEPARTLFVVEGPTDCAAALTLGLNTLGRPACIGQEPEILSYVRRVRASRVVIVSDNDEPGLRGAAKLQAMLPVMNCLWIPPAKDIRQFVSLGGDRETLEASLKDLVWSRPRAIAA